MLDVAGDLSAAEHGGAACAAAKGLQMLESEHL
jgi:hypothetical protein